MTRNPLPGLRHIQDDEAAAVVFAPGHYPGIEEHVRAHAAICGKCAERLRVLRAVDRTVANTLTILDAPTPSISAAHVVARARERSPAGGLTGGGRRVAAAIAIISVAAVAAAALPASPFHGLILRELQGIAKSKHPNGTTPVIAAISPVPPGVFLTPDSSLDVVFIRRNTVGMVHISIVDGLQASLTSPDSGSKYRVSSERIVVDQSPQASFELKVPRFLRVVHVWVGGELALDRHHGSLADEPRDFTIQLFRSHSNPSVQ